MLRSLEHLVDRLPKAAQLRRSPYGHNTRAGVDLLLGHRSALERENIVMGVIRHRLVNRVIFHFHSRLPKIAKRLSRRVPIVGPYESLMSDASAPLIIATAHFGPLFLAMMVLERCLRSRRVIVVLRDKALYLRNIIPFLESLGFAYVIDSQHCIRGLVHALQADPRTVILFAFDNPHRGRRHVQLLNSTIATSLGIAYLADLGEAKIITTFWLWRNARAHMTFDHILEIDRRLPPAARRRQVVEALYNALEAQILAAPEQWSGWDYIGPRVITASQPPAATVVAH